MADLVARLARHLAGHPPPFFVTVYGQLPAMFDLALGVQAAMGHGAATGGVPVTVVGMQDLADLMHQAGPGPQQAPGQATQGA